MYTIDFTGQFFNKIWVFMGILRVSIDKLLVYIYIASL